MHVSWEFSTRRRVFPKWSFCFWSNIAYLGICFHFSIWKKNLFGALQAHTAFTWLSMQSLWHVKWRKRSVRESQQRKAVFVLGLDMLTSFVFQFLFACLASRVFQETLSTLNLWQVRRTGILVQCRIQSRVMNLAEGYFRRPPQCSIQPCGTASCGSTSVQSWVRRSLLAGQSYSYQILSTQYLRKFRRSFHLDTERLPPKLPNLNRHRKFSPNSMCIEM